MFFCQWSIIVLLLLNFWWIFPCQIPWPQWPPMFARTLWHQSAQGMWLGSWWRWKQWDNVHKGSKLPWPCCRWSFSSLWWIRATSEPCRLLPRMGIHQCIKCWDTILEAVLCALSLAHFGVLEGGLDRWHRNARVSLKWLKEMSLLSSVRRDQMSFNWLQQRAPYTNLRPRALWAGKAEEI